MSRTSETTDSNDLRCPCGRCLAKDGQIKCSRCDEVTDTRPRLLDEARHTAFYLSALAATRQILCEVQQPAQITLRREGGSLGYVYYVPPSLGDRYHLTADEIKRQLVVLLTGPAAERLLGKVTNGSYTSLTMGMELARRMVSFGHAVGSDSDPEGAAQRFFDSAMEEATQFVSANRAAIESVAAMLLFKGELNGEDVARLTAGVTPSAPGGTEAGA